MRTCFFSIAVMFFAVETIGNKEPAAPAQAPIAGVVRALKFTDDFNDIDKARILLDQINLEKEAIAFVSWSMAMSDSDTELKCRVEKSGKGRRLRFYLFKPPGEVNPSYGLVSCVELFAVARHIPAVFDPTIESK